MARDYYNIVARAHFGANLFRSEFGDEKIKTRHLGPMSCNVLLQRCTVSCRVAKTFSVIHAVL